jgi:hypothetical protein
MYLPKTWISPRVPAGKYTKQHACLANLAALEI